MKKRHFIHVAACILIGASRSFAADSATDQGTVQHDGAYYKTGTKSHGEVHLANKTVARLGANTTFKYSAASNQIDLQSGTILFSKPKDGKPMTIKTASGSAEITGTTGFLQKNGDSFTFGLIEGTATLTIDGVDYTLTAGEMLKFTPGSPPQILAFDVPLLLSTCPLITRFPHDLPNEGAIGDEVADYNDLVGRGFIQEPKDPFFLLDVAGFVPTIPFPGTDSAGQALDKLKTPPPPPPPFIPPPPPPPPKEKPPV